MKGPWWLMTYINVINLRLVYNLSYWTPNIQYMAYHLRNNSSINFKFMFNFADVFIIIIQGIIRIWHFRFLGNNKISLTHCLIERKDINRWDFSKFSKNIVNLRFELDDFEVKYSGYCLQNLTRQHQNSLFKKKKKITKWALFEMMKLCPT